MGLLSATGILGSGVEQRTRATFGVAAFLFVGEQFSDSCMYFVGTQNPSHVLRAIFGLHRLGGRLLDKGYHHGGVWTTIPNRTHVSKNSATRTSRHPLSTLGESCGNMGFPRVGRYRGLQEIEVFQVGGTGLFANVAGWIERRLRIK